jgi:hypothetical protein
MYYWLKHFVPQPLPNAGRILDGSKEENILGLDAAVEGHRKKEDEAHDG